MKKLLFVFNPASGRARIRSKLYEIVDFYTTKGYLVTTYPTQTYKEDSYLFQCMKDSYDIVICSGGDGTFSNMISEMLYCGKTFLLGYLPSGSTNDFGRSVGIPTGIQEALNITVYGRERSVDIGKFNDKFFIYVAGFGAFTKISYSTSQKMKNVLGYLAYVLEGIKTISELKAYHLEILHDNGTEEGDFIVGLVTNSYSIAGFKNPVHSFVKLDDGLFEILFIRMPKNIIDLQIIISALINENIHSQFILCLQTGRLEINSDLIEWTLDGEYGGRLDKVQISSLKGALKLMLPDENKA